MKSTVFYFCAMSYSAKQVNGFGTMDQLVFLFFLFIHWVPNAMTTVPWYQGQHPLWGKHDQSMDDNLWINRDPASNLQTFAPVVQVQKFQCKTHQNVTFFLSAFPYDPGTGPQSRSQKRVCQEQVQPCHA